MTEKEKKLIVDFTLNKITNSEFFSQFKFGDNIGNYIISNLQKAFKDESPEDIENILLLYFNINDFKFDTSHIQLLCDILLEKWHHSHEDLAMILQKLKDPKSISFLEKAMYLNLEYLEYNDGESLIRKCAYALGDINSKESWNVINSLSKSDNCIISNAAIEQLDRRK